LDSVVNTFLETSIRDFSATANSKSLDFWMCSSPPSAAPAGQFSSAWMLKEKYYGMGYPRILDPSFQSRDIGVKSNQNIAVISIKIHQFMNEWMNLFVRMKHQN
jgi:hypothetical protein